MKRFKLLDGKPAVSEPERSTDDQIRWDLCVLRQTEKPEVLQCSKDSKRSDRGAGYKSLVNALFEFAAED